MPNFRETYFVNGFTEKRQFSMNMEFNILPEIRILDTRKSDLLASDRVINDRPE